MSHTDHSRMKSRHVNKVPVETRNRHQMRKQIDEGDWDGMPTRQSNRVSRSATTKKRNASDNS